MKKYLLTIVLFIFVTGCFAQSGKKFLGIWQPVDNRILPKNFVLFIAYEKGSYQISTNKSTKSVNFEYTNSDHTLIGKIDGSFAIIRYLEKSGNILMTPQTRADAIEFKKASFSK